MEESRQKLFVQLFAIATVISLSGILTVYIASTYYKDVSDLSYWTPVPSDTATPTLVPPTQPTVVPTSSPTFTQAAITTKNCTYSALYWFYHAEAWPPQIVVGSLTYSKEEALAILQAVNPDSADSLFSQLHGAILNYLSGADFDAVRQTAIDASTWLNSHPDGVEITEEDRLAALTLEKALEEYNLGVVGPGRCPDEPAAPVLASTNTPTLTNTPIPSITATNTPVSPPPAGPPTSTRRPRPTNPPKPPADTPKPPTEKPKPTPVP